MVFLLKNRDYIILLIFSIIFFVLYNYLNFTVPGQFNSPDETANFVFIQQVVQHTSLKYPLPFDYGKFAEFIHPRSAFVQGTNILPVGFWGLTVLYGLIAKIVGMYGILFLTPLFAICGAWALYGIFKKIFDERIALFSTLLYITHPVVWYYSTRSLFPNVPFVSLLLIGIWFLMCVCSPPWQGRGKIFWDIVGMSFVMLAVLIRPNEIIWMALGALIILIGMWKSISWKRLVTWVVVGLFFGVLLFTINSRIYENAVGTYVTSGSIEAPHWYTYIFPFGVHLWNMFRSGVTYFTGLLWWITFPALAGIIYFFYMWAKKKEISRIQKVYLMLCIAIGLFLWTYYGSLNDTLFYLKTIGVSYNRYWLPIDILVLPFVAYLLVSAVHIFKNKKWYYSFIACIFLLIVGLSFQTIFLSVDGLFATQNNLLHAKEMKQEVLAKTEVRAIIISDYDEKFFWPDRQVMVKFGNPRIGDAIGNLVVQGWPVYYETPVLSTEQRSVADSYLKNYSVRLVDFLKVEPHEVYKIQIINQKS